MSASAGPRLSSRIGATDTPCIVQMQQMLRNWQAANPALLQASASALSQPTLDTLGKMMGAVT